MSLTVKGRMPAFLVLMAFLTFSLRAEAHKPEEVRDARPCYVAGVGAGSIERDAAWAGAFGGCLWGSEQLGFGFLAGFSHPISSDRPIRRFSLEGELHAAMRVRLWHFDVEGSVGVGASALMHSASLRAAMIFGLHPHPIGFHLGLYVAHYPRAWNFGDGENDDEVSAEIHIGPSFQVMTAPTVILIPWFGVAIEDFDDPIDSLGTQVAGTLLFPF